MTEPSHRVEHATENLQILEMMSPQTKKLTLCPLISPFVILTIRGHQNAPAHKVLDQNVPKQRKSPHIPLFLVLLPTKNITC